MEALPINRELPTSKVLEFAPRTRDYVVMVFVINEGERIQKQIGEMAQFAAIADLVIADGGSTDGSLQPDHLRANGFRAVLTKTSTGKLSAQMRMAFAWALDEGYKGVIVIDGNGKDGVSAIPDFVRLLDDGFDHVQGSRFVPGGKAINTPISRLLALKILHAPLISLVTGKRHTDTTNGFRGYSERLLSDPEVDTFRDVFQTYELHYHLDIESSRRADDFRTTETPVTRAYPEHGKTPTKISPFRGNLHVLSVLFKAASGTYRRSSRYHKETR